MGEHGPQILEIADAHSILASLPMGVVIVDAQGQMSYANLASARILGIDRARLAAHSLAQALHLDDLQWQHAVEEAQVMGEATMVGGRSHLGDAVHAIVATWFGGSGDYIVVLANDTTSSLHTALVPLAIQSLGRDAVLRKRLHDSLLQTNDSLSGLVDFKQRMKAAFDEPNATSWDTATVTHRACDGHFGRHGPLSVHVPPDLTHAWTGAPEGIVALLTAVFRAYFHPSAPATILVDYDAPAQHVVWQLSPNHSGTEVDILVQTLAHAMGAEVLVEGHGVEVRLPVTAAPVSRVAPRTAPSAAPQRPRVLLVEDDAVTSLLTIGRIELLGVDVVHRQSRAEAIVSAHAEKFDLLIVDAMLRDTDARALVDAVHHFGPARRPRAIIVCSGFSEGSLPASLRDAPIDGVVSKPVSTHDIESVLLPHLFPPTPTESETLPVLDPQTIGTLQALSPGQDLVNRVLTKFLDDLTESHPTLATALGDDDLHTIARTAHRVKGAAATVGALRIELVCRQLEHAAKAGDRAQLGAYIAELVLEGQQIELALADRYA